MPSQDIQKEPNIVEYSDARVAITALSSGDPFSIITNESGVSSQKIASNSMSGGTPKDTSVLTTGTTYTVYGGDSAWNQNFIDFFPVPTNVHKTNGQPIISKDSAIAIKTIKGPPPGRYGQSLGGTVIIYPETVQATRLKLGLSIHAPYLSYKQKLGENARLFTIARQSIDRYTTMALAEAADDSNIDRIDSYFYGDWFLAFTLQEQNDVFKVLALAYYDTAKIKYIGDGDTIIDSVPYFLGGGIQWRKIVLDKGLNVVDFVSYYSAMAFKLNYSYAQRSVSDINEAVITNKESRIPYGYDFTVNAKIWYFALKDVFTWVVTNQHIVSAGATIEYSIMNADYQDRYLYKDILGVQHVDDEKKDLLRNILFLYFY